MRATMNCVAIATNLIANSELVHAAQRAILQNNNGATWEARLAARLLSTVAILTNVLAGPEPRVVVASLNLHVCCMSYMSGILETDVAFGWSAWLAVD